MSRGESLINGVIKKFEKMKKDLEKGRALLRKDLEDNVNEMKRLDIENSRINSVLKKANLKDIIGV